MTTETDAEIEVRVPGMLRGATAGEKVVRGQGSSVREVFDDLATRYPGFGEGLFGPDKQLRQFVNVYLDDEDIRYLGGLETEVKPGDSISILPAIAGGAFPLPAGHPGRGAACRAQGR